MRGGSCCGMALVLALVRLQRAERLRAAAAAEGRCRAAAQAGRDGLPERHRQHRRGQRHDAGGARARLHPGNRLQDGDAVKAGRTLFVIEPEPYQLALEQAQSSQCGGRRLRQAVAGGLRAPAGAGRPKASPRSRISTRHRPSATPTRPSRSRRQPTSSRPSSTSATPRSRRLSTASSRRARCRWASWSSPAPRRSPASSSSTRSTSLQRQRAGRAAGSRQHGQSAA